MPNSPALPNAGPIPPLPPPLPSGPVPNPGQIPIPLPPVLTDPSITLPTLRLRSVRCGCYLINYRPVGSQFVTYDGTLRVQCHSNGRTASADLYQRRSFLLPVPIPRPVPPVAQVGPRIVLPPGPNPSAGIPVFPRVRYRYYLSVVQILENFTFGKTFTLGFQRWRFNPAASGGTASWTDEGTFTAVMEWIPAPVGYPSSADYLEGDVKDAVGTVVGRLTMGWVSKYLRKATIEVDRVSQSEAAINNAAGVDWRVVGDGVDWDLTVVQSDANVAEPSGESWSNAECHAAMLSRRDASNLDGEWRYHVLCVRRLDATERGIMYDNSATDSNNVPREGCAISSHWVVPNTAQWGLVRGLRFGTAAAPYFRTAVHEIGHAMGLYHNTVDNGFLNTTDVIASSATAAAPFPNNIQWSYAADDGKRLRHMPDIYVRPGGTPFGTSYPTTPISPDDSVIDAPDVELKVEPLLVAVPLGAPVRVRVSLAAIGDAPVEVPSSVSLGSGFISGEVIDSSGAVRGFSPLVLCADHLPLTVIEKQGSVDDSLTLLRGGHGPLFPIPGPYTIRVRAQWDAGGVELSAVGTTSVMVTSAVDDAHANAALKVLSTPDTLLTLVLGGDHVKEGIAAVEEALRNPVLRPHFAHVEAKRLAARFGKRKPDYKAAADLIDDAAVLSPAEIRKAAEFAAEIKDAAVLKGLARRLKAKAESLQVADDVKAAVDSL